jgi:hypothetical protein
MENKAGTTRIDLKVLWQALTDEEKERACQDFWEDPDRWTDLIHYVYDHLSQILHFREKYLKKRSLEEKTRFLFKFILRPSLEPALDAALRSWLLAHHRSMICSFLDSLGIPHENGLINDDPAPPDSQAFSACIQKLLSAYEPRIVCIYIGYLVLTGDDTLWTPLQKAVEEIPLDFAEHLSQKIGTQEVVEPTVEEEEKEPERTSSFTTLDHLLIKTMVASALQVDHALPEEHVEHLIDEVVELNVERKHSFFHRGFFNALFNREMAFDFPGANDERRSWYFCGAFMGYLRGTDKEKCRNLLINQISIVQELVNNRALECGAMLLPYVYPILLKDRKFDLLKIWLLQHIFGLWPTERERFLLHVYYDAARMLRRGASAEAGLLLETLNKIVSKYEKLDSDFVNQIEPLIARKQGQASQLEGKFAAAQTLFSKALEKLDKENAANTLADLGLVSGGFRSLKSILPAGNMADTKGIANSLAKGKDFYLQAIDQYGTLATNAHFCMGILYFVGAEQCEEKCAHHLQIALDGMLQKHKIYNENGLVDWTRFLLGIALLEVMDPANLQNAIESIQHNLENKIQFPMWLWEKVLESLKAFDVPDTIEDVAHRLFQKRNNEAFQTLWSTGFYTIGAVQKPFFEWIKKKKEATFEKWGDLETLFHAARKQEAIELCETILDFMEIEAQAEQHCRLLFIEFLEKNPLLQPIWNESDINALLVRLYELNGNFIDAAPKLRSAFFQCRDGGEAHQIQEARQIIQTLQDYGLGEDYWKDLHQCLSGLEQKQIQMQETENTLRAGSVIHVLYIGGNEIQTAYKDSIQEEIRQNYPGLKCKFLFPGWNTNWQKDFDEAKPYIAEANVVVINKLIRTHLGRALRKHCGSSHPWISCCGRGRHSIQNRIIEAAQWACTLNKYN